MATYVCGDMLNLFMDFTSQPDSKAKHFDTTMLRHNHAVVFGSGMYKTEGASLYKDDNDGTVYNQMTFLKHLYVTPM